MKRWTKAAIALAVGMAGWSGVATANDTCGRAGYTVSECVSSFEHFTITSSSLKDGKICDVRQGAAKMGGAGAELKCQVRQKSSSTQGEWWDNTGIFRIVAAESDWKGLLKKNRGRYPISTGFTIESAWPSTVGNGRAPLNIDASNGDKNTFKVSLTPFFGDVGPATVWTVHTWRSNSVSSYQPAQISVLYTCGAFQYKTRTCLIPKNNSLAGYVLTTDGKTFDFDVRWPIDRDEPTKKWFSQHFNLAPAYDYTRPIALENMFVAGREGPYDYCSAPEGGCANSHLGEFAYGQQDVGIDLKWMRGKSETEFAVTVAANQHSPLMVSTAAAHGAQVFTVEDYDRHYTTEHAKSKKAVLNTYKSVLNGRDIALTPLNGSYDAPLEKWATANTPGGFSRIAPAPMLKFEGTGLVSLHRVYDHGDYVETKPLCVGTKSLLLECSSPSIFKVRYVRGPFRVPPHAQ